MNGKKIFSIFMLLSLGLSAFRTPQPTRPAAGAKVVVQWLTVVHGDGSSDYEYILKISAESLQLLRSSGSFNESTLCDDAFKNVENSVIKFVQEPHGADIWCVYTKKLDDLPALEAQWKDDFDHLTIRRLDIKGGTFTADLSWTSFPCSTPDTSVLTCEWSLQMPGKVGDNNATHVDGTTLTWDMSSSSTPYHFTAQSAAGGSSSTMWIILVVLTCCCCLVVVLAGGGIAAYFIMRKRNTAPAVPAAAAASGPVSASGITPQP
jgi:hypothetical protein